MKDKTEAKCAWVLWELFTDFNNLLWDRYEEEFLEFILQEEDPTKKEQLITDEAEDELPF